MNLRSSLLPPRTFFCEAAIVLGYFHVIFFFFFAPVVFNGQYLAPGDAQSFSLPHFFSEKTLWTPLLLSGFPVAADCQAMTYYPLAYFCSLVGAWNYFVILGFVLAASFGYAYIKSLTSSQLAAVFGAHVFSMSGFLMAHLGHVYLVHTAAWLPLSLLTIERLSHRLSPGWFLIGVASVAMMALAGYPQLLVYGLFLCGVYALILTKKCLPKPILFLGLLLVLVVLGIGVAGIQLCQTYELTTQSYRVKLTFDQFIQNFIPVKQLITFIFPYLFGGKHSWYGIPYFGQWTPVEVAGYLGLLPLMVMPFALYGRDRSQVIFWMIVGLIALLATLGPATPLAKTLFHISPFNKFRAPSRHLMEVSMAVAVLSGYGVRNLSHLVIKRNVIHGWSIGFLLIMAFSYGLVFVYRAQLEALAHNGTFSAVPWINRTVGIPLFVFGITFIAFLAWSRWPTNFIFRKILIVILIVDLGSFAWFLEWKYYSPEESITRRPPLAEKYTPILADSRSRMLPIDGVRAGLEGLMPNLSRMWGVPSASGYGPFILRRYGDALMMHAGGGLRENWIDPENQALDLMRVEYIVVPTHYARHLNLRLGKKPELIDHLTMAPENPKRSSLIQVVSALASSVALPNGTKVLEVTVNTDHGLSTHALLAGIDTSEWAYDLKHVQPRMQHDRAVIAESYPVAGGIGHYYLGQLKLNEPATVKSIHLQSTGAAEVRVRSVAFADANSDVKSYLSPLWDNSRWEFMERTRNMNVFRSRTSMPRAWMVPEVIYAEPAQILDSIHSSELPDGRRFDPERMALVEAGTSFLQKDFDSGSEVKVTLIDRGQMQIMTHSRSAGYLVVADSFYPGWKAWVDGEPTPVYRTNGVGRGLYVPSGGHLIRLQFRPKGYQIGLTLSSISAIVSLVVAMVLYRNEREWESSRGKPI